jgi:hypothetical protein
MRIISLNTKPEKTKKRIKLKLIMTHKETKKMIKLNQFRLKMMRMRLRHKIITKLNLLINQLDRKINKRTQKMKLQNKLNRPNKPSRLNRLNRQKLKLRLLKINKSKKKTYREVKNRLLLSNNKFSNQPNNKMNKSQKKQKKANKKMATNRYHNRTLTRQLHKMNSN